MDGPLTKCFFFPLIQEHVPQACSVCSETLTGSVQLSKHMKRHQETPDADNSSSNVCNLCGKNFTSKYQLQLHLKKEHGHVDPGVYSCNICQTTFQSEGRLEKHMKRHQSGLLYDVHHEKTEPKVFVAVIPKEGWDRLFENIIYDVSRVKF